MTCLLAVVGRWMAVFCQINQGDQLVDPDVLCGFDGYRGRGVDPNILGRGGLAQSNVRISSCRRFGVSACGGRAGDFSFINFGPLWPCLHLGEV